jgi:hypothetical protein
LAGSRKVAIWAGVGVVLGVLIAILVSALPHLERESSLTGAVVTADQDPRKQVPIPNVEITGYARGLTARATSDLTGYFRLTWHAWFFPGQRVAIRVQHRDYQVVETTVPLRGELYIAHLKPLASEEVARPGAPEITLTGIRVRYAIKSTNTVDVGSTVQTFEVVNDGNVPCQDRPPCSPDGKWKASVGSFSQDAGPGQQFQNVRVSCIAGPCPFARIETDRFSRGGRVIGISVRAWSDTVTFLVEAEVVRTSLSDRIREAYPAKFGRTLTFTLPPSGQGPSIQAEVNGAGIVFPLGPDLKLSWASCTLQVSPDRTQVYTCTLKPGYRFR